MGFGSNMLLVFIIHALKKIPCPQGRPLGTVDSSGQGLFKFLLLLLEILLMVALFATEEVVFDSEKNE